MRSFLQERQHYAVVHCWPGQASRPPDNSTAGGANGPSDNCRLSGKGNAVALLFALRQTVLCRKHTGNTIKRPTHESVLRKKTTLNAAKREGPNWKTIAHNQFSAIGH